MIARRVVRWLDDRLAAAPFAHTTLNRVFPDHFSFLLGEVALYCFIVLLATGTFLAMFFEPSVSEVVYQGCLLYTSPSPRDRTRSRMPSSA